MGLFDFVKDAGAKIFGGEEEKPVARSGGDMEEMVAKHRAAVLRKAVADHGLQVEDLEITVKGELAVVSGSVADQATREKVVLAVGNVQGVARVDDRLTVAAAAGADAPVEAVEAEEGGPTFHTVQKGETLSGIAKQHYGKASKYHAIFEANKPMLTDPDKIYPGQVLRIPKLDG